MPQGPPGETASSLLGFLALSSRPAALVLIDGVDIGQMTPLPGWPLKPGQHQVRLVTASREREVAVESRSGETHSETVALPGSSRRLNRL